MEYSIKEIAIDEESLKEITRFLQETFPKNKKFTLDFIRWQYALNPLGKMVGFNAFHEGQIISHFAALPLKMNLFGKERRGVLCINVSTNDQHRGKKLFTILGEKTIEKAQEMGYDFMIAVPNANSSHAFLKYFGFYQISPLTVKLGFGKDIYPENTANCSRIWDDEQWEWRFQNPANRYDFDKKGVIHTPISFFAKTLSQAKLSESMPGKYFTSLGLRPLNLYIGLGADTSKGLYFDMPSFVKRPPFNLVFRDFRGDIPEIKKEDVFLQLIDLDTV